MKRYDLIPLPKLRRMYRSRRQIRRILAELMTDIAFMVIYGGTMGLMIMGLWPEL